MRHLSYRRLALLLLALSAFAVLVWWFASRPVLFESGTRTIVLNPFRPRAPERTAGVFLHAASNMTCSPDLSDALCRFVQKHPLPTTEWRLVNRWDSGNETTLVYKLREKWERPANNDRCLMAEVILERSGANWKTVGYGVHPGPCNGSLRRG
jgi:hypothetical protein